MGNCGLRRTSRSPRSQRSRSADVDCLKKYTERRVEERRYTEVTDPSKLDTSRWAPLPRNLPRGQQLIVNKTSSWDEWQESVGEPKPSAENRPVRNEPGDVVGRRQHAIRSHSTDVAVLKGDKPAAALLEHRRHTDCSDPRAIATRWMPHINGTKFYRESSPLVREEGCEVTKSAATRWMTLAKNPSPSPIPRMNPERKDSATEHRKKEEDAEPDRRQPPRKFSPAKSERGHLQRQDELDVDRDRSASIVDANDRANKLSQRMRDLYDFKTENEWPKRTAPARECVWISKSSSEEDRTSYPPVRRNSQDMEFNDRIERFKSKAQREQDRQRHEAVADDGGDDVFVDEKDERLRKFNDKLRYSEDRGTERVRVRERRTYSDDYEEKARRESRLSLRPDGSFRLVRPPTPKRIDRQNKRNSDGSARSRESRVSYLEVEFQKKDPRVSDANRVGGLAKHSSVECKSMRQVPEVPPRRAFSQSDERPATPVPPIEWNDESYVPKRLSSERGQKRDSTRYKVYLT